MCCRMQSVDMSVQKIEQKKETVGSVDFNDAAFLPDNLDGSSAHDEADNISPAVRALMQKYAHHFYCASYHAYTFADTQAREIEIKHAFEQWRSRTDMHEDILHLSDTLSTFAGIA